MIDNLFSNRFKPVSYSMPDPPMEDPDNDEEEDKTSEPPTHNN